MIYDLRFINHHRWFTDLKSLKSNQPNFYLRFRFIIQSSTDLAEHCKLGVKVEIGRAIEMEWHSIGTLIESANLTEQIIWRLNFVQWNVSVLPATLWIWEVNGQRSVGGTSDGATFGTLDVLRVVTHVQFRVEFQVTRASEVVRLAVAALVEWSVYE